MNRIFCILLTLSIIALSLCACGTQGEQSNDSESDNKTDTSQQSNEVASTEAPTTEPATEPSYENTNFIAQPPQGKVNYTAKEIFVDHNGISRFGSSYAVLGNYLFIGIDPSLETITVIYDSDGNIVANFDQIAVEKGYRNCYPIRGTIYNDYYVVQFTTSDFKNKFFLYNLKTKEMTDIGDYVSLDNDDTVQLDYGVIIICKHNTKGSKYGALDLELNEIIPCEYDSLYTASNELLIAEKNNKYGLIDKNNNVIADFKYNDIYPFTGIPSYKPTSKTYRIIDFEENINKYTLAVTENDKYVLLDKKGNENPIDFDLKNFAEKTESYVLIDTDGNETQVDDKEEALSRVRCTVEPLGNGLFAMKNDKDLFIYKISAN